MSETNPVENMEENINQSQYENVQVHYGCCDCGKLFVSEKLCAEHLETCDSNTSIARDSVESNEPIDNIVKIKLGEPIDNTVKIKLGETDDKSELKKELDQELKQRYGTIETSSQMLSHNEMLVTLSSYNGCITEPMEFCNEIDIGYEQQSEHSEENSVNFTQEYTPQIEPQIYDDQDNYIIERTPSDPLQENCHAENDPGNLENDEARTITVLNDVDVNQLSQEEVSDNNLLTLNFNECNFELLSEVHLVSEYDDRIACQIEEREVENTTPLTAPKSVGNKKVSGINNRKQKVKQQPKRNKSKIKSIKTNQTKNTSDTNKNKSTDPVERKGTRKSKKIHIDIRGINEQFKDVLYREITIEKDCEASEKQPEEPDVYEFYDEEEEQRKREKERQREIQKDLKRRTCRQCNKVSADAMAALRHHREAHKFPKIFLSKKELEPYLQLDKPTQCPLCFIKLKPYRSLYESHLLTHSDEYSFQCRVCHIKFRRADHWRNHENRHVVTPEELGVVE